MIDTEIVAEIRSVRRTYKASKRDGQSTRRVALDAISLTIERGQWLTLLGPNGSGKSTLLNLLATLDAPDSGEVILLGVEPADAAAAQVRSLRRQLGVVFQSPGLDPILTVRENLRNQASLFGVAGAESQQRIEAVARELGVEDRLDDRVGSLSGGLARRVDLARALLPQPALLLLDEPTTGLDLDARRSFLEAISRRRAADASLTVVMTTHMMDEADIADRVALLASGRIEALGSPDELRRSLGGVCVRCDASHEKHLVDAGLNCSRAGADAVGAGEIEQVKQAASSLLAAGVSHHVGPPTLGDVYLATTGRSLAPDDPSAGFPATRHGRRRRSRR